MKNASNGLRVWQAEALGSWMKTDGPFLLNACPSAGKTRFTSRVIKTEIERDRNVFAVVVVPSDSLKTQWAASMFAADEIQLQPNIKPDGGFPSTYNGVCVTYQQLASIKDTLKIWARSKRMILVLDEVHHCSEVATWGTCAEEIGIASYRVLSLTGTSWRSDGNKIPFVKYDDKGFCVSDYKYTYQQAIIDRVSRRVEFQLIDSEVERRWTGDNETEMQDWSKCHDEIEVSKWLRLGLKADCPTVKKIIETCDVALQKMHAAGDGSAACGLHCLSSGREDSDDQYVDKIAKLVRNLTGTTPLVIHHKIEGVAEKIARFKESKNPNDRYIVSIKQFGEGVDIPRCRVGGYLSNVTTSMYLHQVTGRYIRYESQKNSAQYAVMVMPCVPIFKQFAQSIEKECAIALEQREENDRIESDRQLENSDPQGWETVSADPNGGAHVISGSIIDFEEDYHKVAQELSSQFQDIPLGTLALIVKRANACVLPAPVQQIEDPQHVQAKQLRVRISRLAMQVHYKKIEKYPEARDVHKEANKRCGVPAFTKSATDWIESNKGIDGFKLKIKILESMLGESR